MPISHRRRQLVRAVLFVLALSTSPALASTEPGPVPGTKVVLTPPAGFTPATQFPGFLRTDVGASIVVTEIPAPVAQIGAGMTRAGLASRGMNLLDSRRASVAGRTALLLHVTQEARGVAFEKWMTVFGDEQNTVLVVGTFPQALASDLSEPIRDTVLTAMWDPGRQVGLLDGLTFRVSETASLKFAERISNTLLLTRNGNTGTIAPEEPLAVVSESLGTVDIGDLEGYATRRLSETAEITGLGNLEGRTTTVAGLPAYEITADANDRGTGTPLRIYQLVALDDARYFLVQGLVGATQAERFLPEFRQLATSLTLAR